MLTSIGAVIGLIENLLLDNFFFPSQWSGGCGDVDIPTVLYVDNLSA